MVELLSEYIVYADFGGDPLKGNKYIFTPKLNEIKRKKILCSNSFVFTLYNTSKLLLTVGYSTLATITTTTIRTMKLKHW